MNKNDLYYELKHFLISDHSEKYFELNEKLINCAKNYFAIKSESESKINISSFLAIQHNLIKELVELINNILLDIRNNELLRKYEENQISQKPATTEIYHQPSPKINTNIKRKIYKKNIIPLNVIAPKSNIEFNGTVSFLNFNLHDKSNNLKNENPKPLKKNLFKSSSCSNIITTNSNNYTYRFDRPEQKEKKIPIFNEIYDTFGEIPLSEKFRKMKNKIKYRSSSMPILTQIEKNKEKIEYELLPNSSSPTLLAVSDSIDKFIKKNNRSNKSLINKNLNKKCNIKGILFPSRLTKELLDNSHRIIKKYQKRNKNNYSDNINNNLNRKIKKNNINCYY